MTWVISYRTEYRPECTPYRPEPVGEGRYGCRGPIRGPMQNYPCHNVFIIYMLQVLRLALQKICIRPVWYDKICIRPVWYGSSAWYNVVQCSYIFPVYKLHKNGHWYIMMILYRISHLHELYSPVYKSHCPTRFLGPI